MDSVIGTDLETGSSHFVDPSTLLLSIFLEILLEIVKFYESDSFYFIAP